MGGSLSDAISCGSAVSVSKGFFRMASAGVGTCLESVVVVSVVVVTGVVVVGTSAVTKEFRIASAGP